ncbi:MAG: alpha/beta fold hydrolase [Candidatus Binatia bacterium]
MFASTADARIHALVQGSGAPPLLIIHGLGSTSDYWRTVLVGLEASRMVIAPDLRGCGRSEAGRRPLTIELMAEDMIAILDELGVNRCHLAGISLGGVIVQRLLLRYPDRFSSSVLISTSSRVSEKARAAWRRIADTVEKKGVSGDPAGYARGFSPQFVREHPDFIASYARESARADRVVYAAQARAASDYDYTEVLTGVLQPVLILQGGADAMTPPAGSVILDRQLPHSTLEIIDGVGHNLPIEMGQAFVERVERFLDGRE